MSLDKRDSLRLDLLLLSAVRIKGNRERMLPPELLFLRVNSGTGVVAVVVVAVMVVAVAAA